MSDESVITSKPHIGALDGIRGGLSLWVFWGHLASAVGFSIPVLRSPGLAVDLFMVMSGFLMCWHWNSELNMGSASQNQAFWRQTRRFYIRRFFRIAPVYYLLLTLAFVFQNVLFAQQRDVLTAMAPDMLAIFHHNADSNLTFLNFVSHYSFIFGLFPEYSSSNMLPDWSISLEMQFYLLFPVIMLVLPRLGIVCLAVLSLAVGILSRKLFGSYLVPGLFAYFPQPSMLAFKLGFFVAGIFMAESLKNTNNAKRNYLMLTMVFLAVFSCDRIVLFALIFLIAMLFSDGFVFVFLKNLLASKCGRFLGDLSYSVYLSHVFFIAIALHYMIGFNSFRALPGSARFAVALIVISPMVYGFGAILHWLIELPGIKLGRCFIKKP